MALPSSAFWPKRRGAAIGLSSAITGIAVASGPLVGGAVVQGIDWEWIFWSVAGLIACGDPRGFANPSPRFRVSHLALA